MTHILTRGDTASNWTSEDPVLMERELGFETDTLKAKWGDGVTPWEGLPYAIQPIPNLALYATLASPTFTGNPKAPTQAVGDNSTNIATTAFVKSQGYATLASPTLTGDPKAPTPATADNDTSIATTAFVKAQAYAPLASPALTGNPTAPTPAAADNDTSIATTAFVRTALNSADISSSIGVAVGALVLGANVVTAGEGSQAFRRGNMVELVFYVQAAGPIAADGLVMTLPTGWRPPRVVRGGGTITSGAWSPMFVQVDGSVRTNLGLTTSTLLYGHLVFPLP